MFMLQFTPYGLIGLADISLPKPFQHCTLHLKQALLAYVASNYVEKNWLWFESSNAWLNKYLFGSEWAVQLKLHF